MLTAAHYTDFFTAAVGQPGLGPDELRVSFAVAPDENSTYYVADHVVVHPDWLTAPACLGNSKNLCPAPPAEDIGLVFLQQGVSCVTTGSAASRLAVTIFDGVRSYRDVAAITARRVSPIGS